MTRDTDDTVSFYYSTHMNTTKPLAKVTVIAALNAKGYRIDGPNYRKPSGWMRAPDGTRVYVNFRDLLAELTKG